jgi:hypothetical protein
MFAPDVNNNFLESPTTRGAGGLYFSLDKCIHTLYSTAYDLRTKKYFFECTQKLVVAQL